MEKFIPVVVIKELGETDKILTALKNNGINCAEITFRTACAAEAIAYAAKNYPDMEIGAGTVINAVPRWRRGQPLSCLPGFPCPWRRFVRKITSPIIPVA